MATTFVNSLIRGMEAGRGARRMQMLEQDRAQEAQLRDLQILERLNRSGVPVTEAGTVVEQRMIDPQTAAAIGTLGPAGLAVQPGMKYSVERPVDRARLAEYKGSDGRKFAFELLDDAGQTQRQIQRMYEMLPTELDIAGQKTRASAATADEIDKGRAIPTPKALAGTGLGPTLRPSQFGMAFNLANLQERQAAGDNSLAIAAMGNARMLEQTKANTASREKIAADKLKQDLQIAQAKINAGNYRAGIRTFREALGRKSDGKVESRIEKLMMDARKLDMEAQELHATQRRIGEGASPVFDVDGAEVRGTKENEARVAGRRMLRPGMLMDANGHPVLHRGAVVPRTDENAGAMQIYLRELGTKTKALEAQRDAIEKQIRDLLEQD